MPPADLDIPVPTRIHPKADRIGQRLERWAARTNLAPEASQRARLRATGFHRMAARMIPDATTADVERLAQWITVLFYLDDQQDEGPLSRSTTAVHDTYEALTAVIDGRLTRTGQPPQLPIVAAVAGLWPATASAMSPAWRQRFRHHLHQHKDAFLTQIRHRRNGTTPTPEDYPALRRQANGAFMYDLVEPLLHAEIPAPIAQTRAWREMCEASNDLTAWSNDLVSLPREAAAGETTNYVIVLQHAAGCDLPTAVRQVTDRIQHRATQMITARGQLHHQTRTLTASARTRVAQVAHTICTMPGTHLAWLHESGRYRQAPDLLQQASPPLDLPLLPGKGSAAGEMVAPPTQRPPEPGQP
ncbi:terpene synthase family protein [Streptomyces abikoensis]